MTSFNSLKTIPIPPVRPVDGWKEIPIEECGEKLVPLGAFLDISAPGFSSSVYGDMVYWGEHENSPYRQGELNGALLTPFVREGVAKKLVKAAAGLPEEYAFLIWDPYRTLAVQKALYDDYYQQLCKKRGLDPDAATKEAQRYVSLPSDNPLRPSPHNTGGAVDFTIIQFLPEALEQLNRVNRELESKDWKTRYGAEMWRMKLMREHSVPLNMGTAFDAAVPEAATCFYEDKLQSGQKMTAEETKILQNRRIFYHLLDNVGFSSYNEEWWHKDCGNQFNAIQTGTPAIYGAAEFSDECRAWEKMRIEHYLGSQRTLKSAPPSTKLGPVPSAQFVHEMSCLTGDLKKSCHPQALRLVA